MTRGSICGVSLCTNVSYVVIVLSGNAMSFVTIPTNFVSCVLVALVAYETTSLEIANVVRSRTTSPVSTLVYATRVALAPTACTATYFFGVDTLFPPF